MAKNTGCRNTMLKHITAQKKMAFIIGWYVENVSFKLWLLCFILLLLLPSQSLPFLCLGNESCSSFLFVVAFSRPRQRNMGLDYTLSLLFIFPVPVLIFINQHVVNHGRCFGSCSIVQRLEAEASVRILNSVNDARLLHGLNGGLCIIGNLLMIGKRQLRRLLLIALLCNLFINCWALPQCPAC